MVDLSQLNLDIIAKYPLNNALAHLQDSLKNAEEFYNQNLVFHDTQVYQTTILDLLSALMQQNAPWLLRSQKSGRDVASGLFSIISHIQRHEFNYKHFQELTRLIKQKSSDFDIWRSVLELTDVFDPLMTVHWAFPKGLMYKPPSPTALLDTSGSSWEYQPSPELQETFRTELYRHYDAYAKGFHDKLTLPLYFFLSGPGTGKSRNAKELHRLALQCFDGTHSIRPCENESKEQVQNLICSLTDPYVFHVSLENGMSLGKKEDAWTGIGLRMLLQLLPEYDGKQMTVDGLYDIFIPPRPEHVIECLKAAEPVNALKKKALILVIDGVHSLDDECRQDLFDIVVRLSNFVHGGFYVVCAISTIVEPVRDLLRESPRRKIYLPCEAITAPRTADGQPVLKKQNLQSTCS
ncbi:hypothetical protein PRK78_002739 [Emydomyces testavorans]|uniref:Uncharacterized protein n=1 Tax=Emydomyces testavorans TaxID=2070801 RepID=A0AAF0DFN7_9EURO|nr:hypothetical protein PRK78_002739 [Emydomyces testavorans]